jgi:hypothetical protein
MKAKLLAAAALTLLFSANGIIVNEASASTYTINIDYNPLDGHINVSNPDQQSTTYESQDILVTLPTLFVGDVINTTINFTQGLALRLNDPGSGRQLFQVIFTPDNSATGIVSTSTQLSLILAQGDLLTPDVVAGRSSCATCVAGGLTRTLPTPLFPFRA